MNDESKVKHTALMNNKSQVDVGPDGSDQNTQKPFWRFLESTGGAAFITVVAGGIFGQLITCTIQRNAKDREFLQGVLKSRSDQDILTHSEYLRQQLEIVKQIHDLIGSCIAASEDLIALTGPELTPDYKKYHKKELQQLKKQRQGIFDNYNLKSTQWRADHEKLGLLLNYYYQTKPEPPTKPGEPATSKLDESWSNLEQSVTKYINCARDWYYLHQTPTDISTACEKEIKVLKQNLRSMQSILESTPLFGVRQLESLKKLKSELDK